MDRVTFKDDLYCNGKLIHKANKEYECVAENEEHFFIKQEGCPKNKNWVTQFPKMLEGKIFEFVQ